MFTNILKKRLERSRFEHALEVAESMVEKGAFLNTAELGRINNILRGETTDPWREGAAVCKTPGGSTQTFQMLADPINKAKEILTNAKLQADQSDVIDAAGNLYADLVLTHVFKDANRRTAVIAAAYLLKLHGVEVSAIELHELGLGDLRILEQKEALKAMLRQAVKKQAK